MAGRHGVPSTGVIAAAGTGNSAMFTDPKVTNPPFTSHQTHNIPNDAQVQRGYMRLLGQVLQSNLGVISPTSEGEDALRALYELGAKLDFQFNPNQLVRSVTARTDTQLWINQSPSELLTPGLGDMSFSWQMLFNREEEVQRYRSAREPWSKSGLHAEGGEAGLDALLNNPAEPMVAERIGVLADIMVLDQITGQRLTEAAIKFSEKWALVRADEDGNVPPEEPISADRQKSLLSANLTNSAFLIPNPIRVVFSENFMVDGYVNTVAVSIQKFSPDMVPIVCTVDISMHALYQGFARRSTVFTTLASLEDDDTILGSPNQHDDERSNAEATVVGDASHTLQTHGLVGTPIFAGFDHSPKEAGRTSGDKGAMKMVGDGDRWQAKSGLYKTEHMPNTGERDLHFPKGGKSLMCQHRGDSENAITFGIVSNLRDSGLGEFLRENGDTERAIQYFKGILPRLRIVGYVGLSLRARLKASTQASLNVLWTDGDENGFSTFYKAGQTYNGSTWDAPASPVIDTHFFDRWSTEQRKLLFAVGLDNFVENNISGVTQSQHGGKTLDDYRAETEAQTTSGSEYYTRSFPIMEVDRDNHPGYYGDNFYKKKFEYGSNTIGYHQGNDSDEGWIWGGTKDTPHVISGKDWTADIANGFYTANGSLFPGTLELTNKSTNAVDHEYEIQYQQALTLRVRVEIDDPDPAASGSDGFLPISDTGILLIYPKEEATGIINDVDGAGWTDRGTAGSMTVQGKMRGVKGEYIDPNMEDGYWLLVKEGSTSERPASEDGPDNQGLGNDMFYDGLFQHDGNESEENMFQYGLAYDRTDPGSASLGGQMISSRDIKIGAEPQDFTF